MQIDAEIHYLTKKPFAPILETNPYITKVYTLEKKVSEVLPALRQENYNYLIDLHHNLRSFLVKLNLRSAQSYAFPKLNIEKWLITNFKINRLPQKHIVDRYLETVKPLGIQNDQQGLDFFLPNPQRTTPNAQPSTPYIAFPIGAGKNTKALTVEKIVKICKSVDYKIVLLGGKQEVSKAAAIMQALSNTPKKENSINLVGKCSLAESAAMVKNAALVLTGDTGLMHIAAAFRKPIISIWGNTIPEFGMYPYYPKGVKSNTSLEVKNLSCRPCSKIGYDACPQGHFNCIRQLEVAVIVEAIRQQIP